jgi:flagellar basal-body rod protein FlgB
MSNISVMHLAAQKAEWLATRQAVLAQNIANANTPGYRAKDISPFEESMKGLSLASSSGRDPKFKGFTVQEDVQILESGNSVSIDRELMKIGENTSQYSLDTNLMKSFHRMLLATLKG